MAGCEINGQPTETGLNIISPTYFETMRMPMLRGRNFTDADRAGTPLVAIIDDTFARRFFPDKDAVGQYIVADNGPAADKQQIEIVGVVRGGRDENLGARPHFFVYLPWAQTAP